MKFLRKNKAAFIVLIFAVCFILLGIYKNELQTVLMKAVNVCLECIGIG